MPREISPATATEFHAHSIAPAFFVHLDWSPYNQLNLWGGYGDVQWGGRLWKGLGHLGGISEITESLGLRANGVQLTLSGIPTGSLIDAFGDEFQGRAARIYLGLFDDSGQLIAEPVCLFDGLIDSTAFEDTGETATISVSLEKELIDRRDDIRRYTAEDQNVEYGGDHFFDQVTWLSQNQIYFGTYNANIRWSTGRRPATRP